MKHTHRTRLVVLAGLAGLAPTAWAQMDLVLPFTTENTMVLPKGIRNPRFANLFMDVQNKFDSNGMAQPLGKALNKTVTFGEMANGQTTELQKAQIQGVTQAAGLSPNQTLGSTTGEVNSFADVKVPIFAMGVTERWTLAVAVPVFSVNVSVATGLVASAEGQQFANTACQANSGVDCAETINKLNDAVNTKLVSYGYDRVESTNVTAIGDIQVVNKFQVFKTDRHALALKNNVLLPTGTGPNVNKALDIPTGSGRFGAGVGAIYDVFLPADFRLNAFTHGTALLPNRMVKRIPVAPNEAISPDKEELTRNTGAQFIWGTGVDRRFANIGLTLGAGYTFQYLTAQTYVPGSAYDPTRYLWLDGLKPDETMHGLMLTAGFSTVEWYKEKKFPLPFQANFVFGAPIAGTNVNTNNLLAGELVMFF